MLWTLQRLCNRDGIHCIKLYVSVMDKASHPMSRVHYQHNAIHWRAAVSISQLIFVFSLWGDPVSKVPASWDQIHLSPNMKRIGEKCKVHLRARSCRMVCEVSAVSWLHQPSQPGLLRPCCWLWFLGRSAISTSQTLLPVWLNNETHRECGRVEGGGDGGPWIMMLVWRGY